MAKLTGLLQEHGAEESPGSVVLSAIDPCDIMPGSSTYMNWIQRLLPIWPDLKKPLVFRFLRSMRRRAHARLFGLREPDFHVDHIWMKGIRIPFGDGESFTAWLLRPPGNDKHPTVLMRTPYGKDSLKQQGIKFAERGYVVVAADCRGRDGSKGSFFPIRDEVADAEAIVEWILQQEWYNGNIGVHGVSYDGFCAYAALGGKHADKITCIAPICTSSRIFPIIYDSSGAMNWELAIRWFWLVLGPRKHCFHGPWMLYQFFMRKQSSMLEEALLHAPASEIDSLYVGQELEIWQKGLQSPSVDSPFWQGKDRLCTLSHLRCPCPPIHIFIGWSDIFLAGALADYDDALASGADVRLTIGDYGHFHVLSQMKQVEPGLLHWYDMRLAGGISDGAEKRVRCQLQGIPRHGCDPVKWLGMDAFPPKHREKTCYLRGDGSLCGEAASEDAPSTPSSMSYTYDPLDPTPAIGGPSFHPRNCGRMEQAALERRSDILLFTSDYGVQSDMLFVGRPKVVLYVSCDVEHFDLVARLCVVTEPHGQSYNICDGMSRQGSYTSNGEAPDAPVMTYSCPSIGPDGIMCVEFSLGPCAFELQPGDKLRLQVCSAAHPRWMRNFGTGEQAYNAVRTQSCRVEVLADSAHPSRLDLPLL